MSMLHRTPTAPTAPPEPDVTDTTDTTVPPASAGLPSPPSPAGRVPRTRTGAAWFGICTAALLFVILIVFLLQNTRSVDVTFLWLHGTLPLAIALLIAGVGTAILSMVIGVARITQLRRLSRRQRR